MTAGAERQAPSDPAVDSAAEQPHEQRRWRNRVACAALVILLGVTYLTTLYPGVHRGDAAELQYMCSLLGVCHPPGYVLEVVVGKLFSLLPIGPDFAWRINLMQAVCGVIGCLALYGALRRLTDQVLPGLAAATTLAFSTIYWTHSVVAEVYVFYSMFLLLGLYTAVRFLTSSRSIWLYLTAGCLGICVGGRPSELLVLPALVGLWLGFRGRVRLSLARIGTSVLIAVLPFVLSVSYYMVREDPALLHARDDALRDEILEVGPAFTQLSVSERLRHAVWYSVGLKAAGRADFTTFTWQRLKWDLDKYAWLLSGRGAFGDRFPQADPVGDPERWFRQREQGRGTSIGVLGVLLAALGLRRWRRHYGVVLLGLGMFVGNLVFYLYLHPVDNLNFTIPGLTGLAVLAGLGVSTRTTVRPRRRFLLYQLACLLVPAFLLVSNYTVADPDAPRERDHRELGELVKKTPLPDSPVIIAAYSRAQALRCLYWLDVGRTDVHVFVYRERYGGEELKRLAEALRRRGYTVLLSAETIGDERATRTLARWTPQRLINVGLLRAYPPRSGLRG